MHVLIIVKSLHHSYIGGIQTHVWKISQQLKQMGHQVSIMIAQNILKPKKPFEDEGIQIIPVPYISGDFKFFHLFLIDEMSYNIFVLRRLRRILKNDQHKIDIVHVQGRSGFLYPLFRKSEHPPTVVTFHGTAKSENSAAFKDKSISIRRYLELGLVQQYATMIEKSLIKRSDQLIAVSQQMRKIMKEELKVNPEAVDVIHNGLDLDDFYPDPKKRIPFRIVSVARLDPRKGLKYLIKSVASLVDEFPKISVHIVGEGSHRPILDKQIRDADLQNHIKLIGNKNPAGVLNELQQAELFVLPSLGESQGIVFMEAMICELPVVGFDIGGVNEMVESGVHGFLVEKESTNQLSNAIRQLFRDKKLASKMGKAGRKHIQKHFQWRTVAQKTVEVYQKVIK